MRKHHNVTNISITKDLLSLEIDGKLVKSPLNQLSSILANTDESTLSIYEVSPSGYGIHWPLLDEDISIDGLLDTAHIVSNN